MNVSNNNKQNIIIGSQVELIGTMGFGGIVIGITESRKLLVHVAGLSQAKEFSREDISTAHIEGTFLALCHSCMIENGWERKDRGSHTATKSKCPKCETDKLRLPNRHWNQRVNKVLSNVI